MNPETRDKLMGVSVATLATALFKRGLRNQVIQGVHPVAPKGRNMVGPAFTLRYMPAREDRNQLAEFRNPQHPQRVAIETCPEGQRPRHGQPQGRARGLLGRHPDHPAHGPRRRRHRHRRRLP